MIKAYHNCTLETAELIKTDGMIRSNAELQRSGLNQGRITGLSTKDLHFVFLYPDFFQHSKDRSTYRGDENVAFVFDAVELVKKYRARVGLDIIVADAFTDELAAEEARNKYRWQGATALKRLRQGTAVIEKYGIIELLVPQAIPLTDCIVLVNANTGESLEGEFRTPGTHTEFPSQNRQRKRRRKKR